jgi:hypothetical protein
MLSKLLLGILEAGLSEDLSVKGRVKLTLSARVGRKYTSVPVGSERPTLPFIYHSLSSVYFNLRFAFLISFYNLFLMGKKINRNKLH